MDEAQRGQEQEGGRQRLWLGSVRGPKGGGRAWAWWATATTTATAGDRTAARQMPPPLRFGRGGLSSRPLSIVMDPWTAMARTAGIRSGGVIGVIST